MPSASICRERATLYGAARVVVVLLAALSVSQAALQAQSVSPGPKVGPRGGGTFRAGTELVALPVAVVDGRGRFVSDLLAEDFAVYEEGVQQTVALFATAAAPLDVMFLLDTSGSMVDRMDEAQKAAVSFIRTLRDGDRAAILVFNDGVSIAQAFTEDRTLLEQAVHDAWPSGGTALHEALYVALREIARLRRNVTELRRQALVVLSDGDDNKSKHISLDTVLEEARRSAVTIYTILPAPAVALPSTTDLSWRLRGAEYGMRAVATESGGRFFAPAHDDDLSATYREIADELSQQYWLAYVPEVRVPGFRRVSVRVVTHTGLRARTRSGYFATEGHVGRLRPPPRNDEE
jgi:VWFA-related protein